MPTIMADSDVQGQLQAILHVCNSPEWHELWESLACEVESFESLGIPRDTSDRDVWLTCQQQEIVLVTGNRNEEDATSLEATIRELGNATSLPVLTIGDPTQVIADRDYAWRVCGAVDGVSHRSGNDSWSWASVLALNETTRRKCDDFRRAFTIQTDGTLDL